MKYFIIINNTIKFAKKNSNKENLYQVINFKLKFCGTIKINILMYHVTLLIGKWKICGG